VTWWDRPEHVHLRMRRLNLQRVEEMPKPRTLRDAYLQGYTYEEAEGLFESWGLFDATTGCYTAAFFEKEAALRGDSSSESDGSADSEVLLLASGARARAGNAENEGAKRHAVSQGRGQLTPMVSTYRAHVADTPSDAKRGAHARASVQGVGVPLQTVERCKDGASVGKDEDESEWSSNVPDIADGAHLVRVRAGAGWHAARAGGVLHTRKGDSAGGVAARPDGEEVRSPARAAAGGGAARGSGPGAADVRAAGGQGGAGRVLSAVPGKWELEIPQVVACQLANKDATVQDVLRSMAPVDAADAPGQVLWGAEDDLWREVPAVPPPLALEREMRGRIDSWKRLIDPEAWGEWNAGAPAASSVHDDNLVEGEGVVAERTLANGSSLPPSLPPSPYPAPSLPPLPLLPPSHPPSLPPIQHPALLTFPSPTQQARASRSPFLRNSSSGCWRTLARPNLTSTCVLTTTSWPPPSSSMFFSLTAFYPVSRTTRAPRPTGELPCLHSRPCTRTPCVFGIGRPRGRLERVLTHGYGRSNTILTVAIYRI
jgi:hypothetical protein